jgi:hypothetical protein
VSDQRCQYCGADFSKMHPLQNVAQHMDGSCMRPQPPAAPTPVLQESDADGGEQEPRDRPPFQHAHGAGD